VSLLTAAESEGSYMAYTASHIANYMLDKGEQEARAISPMKLLKLVYFGYGWSLAVLSRKVFDEPIYAWNHGPVVRSLYDEFKHFGKGPIECRSVEFDLENLKFTEPRIPSTDTEANVVLGKVWSAYKNFGAWDLRNMTHESDSPWTQVYQEGVRNKVIPDNLIKDYFVTKIGQYLEDAKRTKAGESVDAARAAAQ
jgi:uncharacterized phage-associated protein